MNHEECSVNVSTSSFINVQNRKISVSHKSLEDDEKSIQERLENSLTATHYGLHFDFMHSILDSSSRNANNLN